jgi:hypothetical protein
MDPLSATAVALALAARCWTAANVIYNTVERYQAVPETLQLIIDQIDITQGSLLAINRFLRDNNIVTLSPELEDIFPRAVKGFEVVLLCLEKEFEGFKEKENWWNRLRTLWKEGTMERHLKNLERRQILLITLMATLNL